MLSFRLFVFSFVILPIVTLEQTLMYLIIQCFLIRDDYNIMNNLCANTLNVRLSKLDNG